MLIWCRKKVTLQVHIFQDKRHFESFQIHQRAMFPFEHTNHGIHLGFLFQIISKRFLRACSLHQ